MVAGVRRLVGAVVGLLLGAGTGAPARRPSLAQASCQSAAVSPVRIAEPPPERARTRPSIESARV